MIHENGSIQKVKIQKSKKSKKPMKSKNSKNPYKMIYYDNESNLEGRGDE